MDQKRHALVFVTMTVFIDTVGFGIIMPVLPQFLMQLTNSTLSQASSTAGLLLVCYAALQFIFAPIIGNLSDRFGRRPVLLVSLAMYAVNYLIAGLATTLWVLFIGRILTGATSATHSTANALIADVSPPQERAQNFGLLGLAFGMGFIVGPSLGGFLGEVDIRLPFFAAAGLAALNTLYGYIVLRETLPKNKFRKFEWKRANPIGMLAHLAKYPVLIGLMIVMFIYNIGHHVYPSNWSFYTIEKFNWTPFDIGLSMALVGLLMAFVQGYLIRIVIPKWGAQKTALVGFMAAFIAYAGIATAQNTISLYTWCFMSAFSGLIGPAISSIMSNQVSQNEQGELQGIIASVGSVAAIIGPLMMTQSFAYFTSPATPFYFPGVAFMIAAGLALVSIVIFILNTRTLDLSTTHSNPNP
ncbi:MAG: TCR/Tet family MFS transporter [Gammaproteobacteria bacterium]|nr:TCR/Tet family MFS transporter [Gammaproteobacteria bacterium]